MSHKIKYAFALVLLCLTALSAQTGSQYEFLRAGNFPGANYTVPLGASVAHIIGYYAVSGANNAYIQSGSSFLDVAPPGSITSYLTAINKGGVAVGGYCTTRGGCIPEMGEHGYLYDFHTAKMRRIDFPMSGAASTAYGINDAGVIVGGYCPNATSCPQGLFNPAADGFIDDHGVFTTFDFPGAQFTSPFAINNAGTIAGFYVINNNGPHAFLYQGGQFTTIDFPGGGGTVATGINNLGVVAGLFSSSTGTHGFTYYNGTFTQIDKPGVDATQVTGINDRNDLVGIWFKGTSEASFKAVPVPCCSGSMP